MAQHPKYRMFDQNFNLKEGVIKNISYERRAYESVDEKRRKKNLVNIGVKKDLFAE